MSSTQRTELKALKAKRADLASFVYELTGEAKARTLAELDTIQNRIRELARTAR